MCLFVKGNPVVRGIAMARRDESKSIL